MIHYSSGGVDMTNYKQGDVFRWRWNEYEYNQREKQRQAGTMYWCCSNICIMNDRGQLLDTYWSTDTANKQVDPSKCSLTYLGNINDYREAQRHEFDYYDDEDIMDISHINNSRGGCYIKIGAKKSITKAKQRVQQKLDEKWGEFNSVKYDIERLTELLRKYDVEDIWI